jgi:PEP-CTERM motif
VRGVAGVDACADGCGPAGNIEGSLFAKSFLGGGELHNNNLFNGALPTIAAVPEPSTWAMLFAGFAGLGFLGWRQARKAPQPRPDPAAGSRSN